AFGAADAVVPVDLDNLAAHATSDLAQLALLVGRGLFDGADAKVDNRLAHDLVSVRKHFESFESFVVQSGDLIREGHHRCGRRRPADVTTAANCDIRVT